MIKNIFLINLKAIVSSFFNSSKTAKKTSSKGKVILFSFLAIYLVIAFLAFSYLLFSTLITPFFEANLGWLYFSLIALMIFAISFITTIFMAHPTLFSAKDNELLLAMPIKPSSILVGRLLMLLIFDYAFVALVAAPATFLWFSNGYATAFGLIYLILGLLALPLLSITISIFVAWILQMVLAKLPFKSFLTIALSLGFLVAYFYVMTNAQNFITLLLENGERIAVAFEKALPPFHAFGQSITSQSFLSCLIFLAYSLIPFILVIYVISLNYRKILSTNKGQVKTIYKEKIRKESSPIISIAKKDLAHFWSVPNVVMNTSLGSIFMIVLVGFLLIKQDFLIAQLSALTPVLGEIPFVLIITAAICFCVTYNNLSASIISLEGNNLWIIKSAPINIKTILNAKLVAHLVISGIPCFIACLISSITFAKTLPDFLISFMLPQVFALLFAVIGLALNLLMPKFEWLNEVYVVKQSMPSMLTMLGGMILVLILGFVYIKLLINYLSIAQFFWIALVVSAVLSAVIYRWILTSGVKRFEAM